MRVAVACEYSGIVRDAFIAEGHEAYSFDLLPTEGNPANALWHFEGDVFECWDDWRYFDLLIGHPPCTRLTNAGVRWLAERDLWEEMREGAAFFNRLRALPVKRKCMENPVMHRYAGELIGRHAQTFQPWQFGEPQFKRTCLWLDDLPPLVLGPIRTDVPDRKLEPKRHAEWSKVHRASPGPNRAKARSEFFPGVARAMATQWGAL